MRAQQQQHTAPHYVRSQLLHVLGTAYDTAVKAHSRYRGNKGYLAQCSRAIRSAGYRLDRVGLGNAKTGTPSNYRSIGDSCPPSCIFLQTRRCYAMAGNTNIHQRNSPKTREGTALSVFLLAGFAASTQGSKMTRLQTSGDLGKTIEDVEWYASTLETITRYHGLYGVDGRTWAWSYTHHRPSPRINAAILRMAACGVIVRFSDLQTGVIPYVAGEYPAMTKMRNALTFGARSVVCPATLKHPTKQLEAVKCTACGLCWRRLDLYITFVAHDPGKRTTASPLWGV